jgi:hypothetical protein
MEYASYQQSAQYVKSKIDFVPEVAMILGTALGLLAQEIEDAVEIPYADIPNFLLSTAPTHAGKLILGTLAGKKVICMSGRFHYYEGYSYEQLALPVRLSTSPAQARCAAKTFLSLARASLTFAMCIQNLCGRLQKTVQRHPP